MSYLHRLSCGWQQCKQAACKQKIEPAIGSGNGIARPQAAGDPKDILHRHIAQYPNVEIPHLTRCSRLYLRISKTPGWNDKKQQSSCHTRADWREHPQRYSKTHKAECQSEELSEISVSKSLFPPQKKGCIAEDKEKSRWLSSRTLTHKRPAAFQKTEADTASSKESQGQSSRKNRSAGNRSVFDLFRYQIPLRQKPSRVTAN